MKISDLPQYKRSAKRFAEIVKVLGHYGLAGFVGKNDPEFVQKLFVTSDGEQLSKLSLGERLCRAFGELGPTFVKLGQMLSTRPDIVGPEVAAELAKLQSGTPADPPEVVRATFVSELGRPPEEVFAEFDATALASASIGQAHAARLADGTQVIVKIQHPGIEDTVTEDMDILDALAGLAERYDEELAQFQPRAAVAEFRRTLTRELDFGREANNLETFARNFEGDEQVHFPAAYRETSSRRVLTMERLIGYSVADQARLDADGVDRRAFAMEGANLYLDMIFRDGVYHADPHPGNVFVLAGGVVGLLDFGMVGRLDGALREDLEDALMALNDSDGEELTRVVMRLGSTPPDLDRQALRADLEDYIGEYGAADIARVNLSGALNDLIEIVRRNKILLGANVSMLLRVLILLEGTSRSLDRNFSLAEVLQPYAAKIVQRRFGPKGLLLETRRRARDWGRLFDRAPRELSDILGRVSEGKFDVNLEHRRLDPSVNKLVTGILAAALFLGSTTVLAAAIPPLVRGVSVFGVVGVVVSLWLGARLLRAIHRSQDLG